MKVFTYRIVIEKESGGGYSAYCPDLPGCFSNGKSLQAARRNMAEAIRLHIETLLDQESEVPRPTCSIQAEELTVGIP